MQEHYGSLVRRLIQLVLIFSAFQFFVSFGQQAQAAQTLTLIAEESFDYSGNIVGQNGGSGFTGGWATHYGVSDYSIQTPGLTYSGLTTAGGYMYSCSATPNTVCGVSRDIPTQTSDAIYIQFLAEFTSQTGGGTPNIRLFDGANNLSGGIGGNGGTAISIFDSAFNTSAQASAGTLNSFSFIVVKIDYTNNKTSMWVNPNLSTFSYFNPPTADAQFLNLAAPVKTLAFYARSGVKYDELKIYKLSGTTSAQDEAAALAARKKAEEERAAKVRLARQTLIQLLESNSAISQANLIDADAPIRKPEYLILAYQELLAFQKSQIVPLLEPLRQQKKFVTIMKYATIEKMESGQLQNPSARNLVNFGLISPTTPQKTRIISVIFRKAPSEWNSLEKFNQLLQNEVNIVENRKARLLARLGE